jgi:hypothetical protein
MQSLVEKPSVFVAHRLQRDVLLLFGFVPDGLVVRIANLTPPTRVSFDSIASNTERSSVTAAGYCVKSPKSGLEGVLL